jgi:hypothetical protein
MSDYVVVCHDDRHGETHPEAQYGPTYHRDIGAEHMHSTTLLLGSPKFGGLWHCPDHRDCPTCPRDPEYVRDFMVEMEGDR